MFLIVLVVCFTMTLFLWAFTLTGAVETSAKASGLLAFLACLILGITVFLSGFGVITWTRSL